MAGHGLNDILRSSIADILSCLDKYNYLRVLDLKSFRYTRELNALGLRGMVYLYCGKSPFPASDPYKRWTGDKRAERQACLKR